MQKLAKRACFEISQNKSSNMLHVVWAEEFKTGLGFEIGQSDLVMTTSQQRHNVQLPGN